MTEALAPATVLGSSGGTYQVQLASGEVRPARLRGRLKLEQRTGDRVVAGDRVSVLLLDDGSAAIESVEPRRTELVRRAPGGRGAKVLVANADQVMIVLAAAHPEPNLRMLDRLLVLGESNQLPCVIVVNKVDLVSVDEMRERFAPYRAAGYDVLFVSALDGTGVDDVRTLLCGRESVLTGPSGAGKSSLLNAVQPGLSLRVGAVSDAVGKGRHTTVSALLVPLECGGYVADTPGLREVGLWGIEPGTLDACFPEFRPYIGSCRFARSCTHDHEPDCAVVAAVDAGVINRGRYDSYLRLLRDD